MTDNVRKRFHSYMTRSRFLHLEDELHIGKVRIFAGEYNRGQGASTTAAHYVDLDDARILFSDLAWGKQMDYTEFKGGGNGKAVTSRILRVNAKNDKVWVELKQGPGKKIGQGAVKPDGNPDIVISVPVERYGAARKLGFAALAYIRVWENQHLLDTVTFVPRSLVYSDGKQVSETNGQEREAFRAYVAVHHDVPASREKLRLWWKNKN